MTYDDLFDSIFATTINSAEECVVYGAATTDGADDGD
jgi:hypothetical protein